MFERLLIETIQGLLSDFSDPVSELPLTYHSKLIDEGLVSGRRDCYELQQRTVAKENQLHSLT
jgi:hypothetical protein